MSEFKTLATENNTVKYSENCYSDSYQIKLVQKKIDLIISYLIETDKSTSQFNPSRHLIEALELK